MKYFSNEKVNTGRQPEMDLFKAFCIFFMILLHSFEDCALELTGVIPKILDNSCLLSGAAAFMICMGIGMRYSRHQDSRSLVTRGISLLTVGQLLNLARNTLPNLIVYWITGQQISLANSLLVFQADILSFAGLSFLFMALLKKLKMSANSILIFSVIMNIFAWVLYYNFSFKTDYLISQFFGYFVITDAESFFPLCSYFLFVAFGYFIGGWYPRIKDKNALSKRIILILLPIVALYHILRIGFMIPVPFLPIADSNEFYSLYAGPDGINQCLTAVVLLAIFYQVVRLSNNKLPSFVLHLSRHINEYYCISCFLIFTVQAILIMPGNTLFTNSIYSLIFALSVVVACYFIIEFNARFLHFQISGLTGKKRIIVFSAIWIASIIAVIYIYPKVTEYATMWNDYLIH